MDHFPAGDWIDSARGVVAPAKASVMQSHLNAGCSECLKASEIWRLVMNVSSRESSYCPPNRLVKLVKAAFIPPEPGAWLADIAQFARLVFDTFKQPYAAIVGAPAQVQPSSRS